MKRSTKLVSLLLAVLMIAALLPTAALADDADTQSIGDTVGSVVDTVNGIKLPTYLVYCSLMSKLPASGAQVTLTNNLTPLTCSVLLLSPRALSAYTLLRLPATAPYQA